MKRHIGIVLLPLAAAVLGMGQVHAEETLKVGGDLTCSGPISNRDTGESLYQRYGEQARLSDFSDSNNNSLIDVQVFSSTDDYLDVKLEDNDFVKNVVAVEMGTNAWSVKGLKVGMDLAEVAAVNGGPFKFEMTDSDVEGKGVFAGGPLGRLDGGCRLVVMFTLSYDPKIARALRAEKISSDNPDLVKLHPVISQLSLLWSGR